MSITSRISVVFALSAMFLVGCGGDSEVASPGEGASGEVKWECSEGEGGWFGRVGNTMISSQTQEACEKRLRELMQD